MASYNQTRRYHNVWKNTSDLKSLEDVQFTLSWRCLIYDVFRMSGLQRPEDVWFTLAWKLPICDVLKTSDLKRLQDVWFTTSWRRLIYDILKTSLKRHLCSNIVATYIQHREKLLFLFLYCLKQPENFKCSSLS